MLEIFKIRSHKRETGNDYSIKMLFEMCLIACSCLHMGFSHMMFPQSVVPEVMANAFLYTRPYITGIWIPLE